ncbi:type II secretion system F family protein [Tautonia marina]|uniref:type II secretion system F family protein n=1 Tax=Tautonia marina TaxID=2653855 RepID=UPI0013758C08|nr:type II secretion system F family protein [Tautonia marina]
MSSRGAIDRLSMDELIALNEEIVALVRAGVPIERGLVGIGGDWKGRLGRVAEALGRRMEAEGCSLTDAFANESRPMPDLYRAIIEAGMRAGRLTAALEGLTTFVRSQTDLRRTITLAMLYPAILLVMAYGLFLGFVTVLAPRLELSARLLGGSTASLAVLSALGRWAWIWGPIGLLILGIVAWLWMRSGRVSALGLEVGGAWRLVFPGVKTQIALTRCGLFADLLALLLENRVPMPDALRLSSRAIGDARLREASDRLADAIQRGERWPRSMAPEASQAFPPMLRWLIGSGAVQGDLPQALRVAARTYRDRAAARAELQRLVIPTVFLVGIGGTAVLLYGLTLFVPFTALLESLN